MTARVVVADDDPDIRQLVAFILKRRDYLVLEADNGTTALELVRREQPDVAILDIMMPGATGLEVAKELSHDPVTAHIPILLLSAHGQSGDIQEGLSNGARSYLVKPFLPKDLADRVATLIHAS